MIIFVVGTGTDVGKTHVTAALVMAAREDGRPFDAWKPIASGTSDRMGDDARAIGARMPPLYAFEPPISPHLAARRAGITVQADSVAKQAKLILGDDAIIESAGGLFSPISDTETNLDLARELEKELRPHRFGMLLVAPDRIGVLHDITATVRAAKILPVLALSAPATADASTGTNAEEIRRLGLAAHVIEFPRAAPAASLEPARRCLEALTRAHSPT